jgi:hypothetical protein
MSDGTMMEFEVDSKSAMIAAVRAAAQPTYEAARKCPVTIRVLNTSCKYLFPEGIAELRADKLVRRIKALPAGAFR